LLDDGPEREYLQARVKTDGLENHVFFLGYRDDIINLMAAADLLVHPSLTEASNGAVKEMGLAQRSVIACRGVGDFSQYLNESNSFLVEMETPEAEITNVLKMVYQNKSILYEKGYYLQQTVKVQFSINRKVVEHVISKL
ncbi:MAG: hypothetical protein JWQ14_2474, partial [Adhaeribacter sp.]|nr:hypothetical protein [Adhaeribacter sp.]